jgi:hypothetical protein
VRTITLSAAETPTGFTRSNASANYFWSRPIFRSLGNQLIFCAADMRTSLNAGEGFEIANTIAKANLVWIDSCYAAARF